MKERIYFDHSATSFPKPKAVADEMYRYLTEVGVNVNRGGYGSAYGAEEVLFDTREQIRNLFHGSNGRNVVFTPNITTSLNIVLKGLLKSGDHVLISGLEHNAVLRPLHQLEKAGVKWEVIECDPQGNLNQEDFLNKIRKETRMVVCTHASNVCGTLISIGEIGEICRKKGILFVVDSAATAGIIPIDMERDKIDILTFTGHKGLLGPQGTGGILFGEDMGQKTEPFISGGTGSMSDREDMPALLPDRFEAGTMNLPGIYGLHAALDYLEKNTITEIRERELGLTGYFLQKIEESRILRENLEIIGRKDLKQRIAVVSLYTEKMDMARIAYELDDKYGIEVRSGLHCAPLAHRTLHTYPYGTLRFSFGYKNTEKEIDIAVEALEEILEHGI